MMSRLFSGTTIIIKDGRITTRGRLKERHGSICQALEWLTLDGKIQISGKRISVSSGLRPYQQRIRNSLMAYLRTSL